MTDSGLVLRRPHGPVTTLAAADPRVFRAGPLVLRFADANAFTVESGRVRGIEFKRR